MPITIEDFKKIIPQMPKRGKGDQVTLSEEDEAALDKAWAKAAEKDKKKLTKSPKKKSA